MNTSSLDPEKNIYDRDTWIRRVDGIEVFPKYLQAHHRHLYSNIYIGNALDIVPTLEQRYDLAMLIDVLEHFTREEGERLLRSVLEKSRGVIVSVPKDIGGEGSNFGYDNEYERHRYQWNARELARFGPSYFLRDSRSIIVYIGADSVKLRLRQYPRLLSFLNRLRSPARN